MGNSNQRSSARARAASSTAGRHFNPGGRTWTEPNRTTSESASLTTQTGGSARAGRAMALAAARPARRALMSRPSFLTNGAVECRAAGLDLAPDDALAAVVAAGLA